MTNIIVSDASVLINFLRIDRVDLLRKCSLDFLVTSHVIAEITENFPDQLNRFQNGLQAKVFTEIKVEEMRELEIFNELLQNNRLGIGECSAIAVAISRKHSLAIDDNYAIKSISATAPDIPIFRTQDLMLRMINENIITINEA